VHTHRRPWVQRHAVGVPSPGRCLLRLQRLQLLLVLVLLLVVVVLLLLLLLLLAGAVLRRTDRDLVLGARVCNSMHARRSVCRKVAANGAEPVHDR
jgi:hypothetical protein